MKAFDVNLRGDSSIDGIYFGTIHSKLFYWWNVNWNAFRKHSWTLFYKMLWNGFLDTNVTFTTLIDVYFIVRICMDNVTLSLR